MSEGPSRKTDPDQVGHIELLQAPALAMTDEAVLEDVTHYYWRTLGRRTIHKQEPFLFQAVAMSVRDRLMERRNNTRVAVQRDNHRRACYLSLEFLMGRLLRNALLNLDLEDEAASALGRLGMELEDAAEREHDAGLGNGGLGRLAACFLDSCATLGLPVTGYGIRYNYGMFRQSIEDGYQREEPDNWLREGFPWEIKRIELAQTIRFGGHSTAYTDSRGELRHTWTGTSDVLAIPYDVPIPGYRNDIANTLRLWSAAATDEFDLDEFNAGGYMEAVAAKNDAEKITMVLYPNTATVSGHELRLRQQYFLASASLQDTLRIWRRRHGNELDDFAEKHCFQLNDTHPAVAVPELMRLLMDEYGLTWDDAWNITRKTMAYTNHTLLPEALEQWPVEIFARLLPRLLDIIVEINERTLAEVAGRWPGDNGRLERMSLITGGDVPMVRMAHLAIVGSYSVNGVAALHSELLRTGLFRDFAELWPDKFNNKTNGVTQRRWLAACNPQLAALITSRIGDGWVTDLPQLEQLRAYAGEPEFQQQWREVKLRNKARLSREIESRTGIAVDTRMMFDVQVKRIHEYKRQLLNLLHAIHLYDRVLRGEGDDILPRAIIIGGKAAPGYAMAKDVIKCICTFSDVINADPQAADKLRLIFFPDYNVSAMELICPAAELSEQISTAGKEASGTGNMKFMMNGALTIGTLDGANVEIREAVGDDNFFLFGLTVDDIEALRPNYDPQAIVAADEDLARVVRRMTAGTFDDATNAVLRGVAQSIMNPHDQWMTAADFRSFVDAQQRVEAAYRDASHWTGMSILNTASSGRFSTDRTISDYNAEIWHLDPVDLKPK
jgi:starch phosphorylase